jgi:hypothetical protein
MKRSLVLAVLSCALCVLSACGGGGNGGKNGGGGVGGPQVATHFTVTAPSTASVSTFFSVTVLALDASNHTVAGYSGTGGSDNLGALATHDSHPATLLAKGKALVTAGSDNSDDLATAELYDPATGTFTATGAMIEARSEHTATLLADGNVLLAGGAAGNIAELYDPATGTFTATGELAVGGRWGCTATLLKDGTVLIAGGRDRPSRLTTPNCSIPPPEPSGPPAR